jgi:hypothetical protein
MLAITLPGCLRSNGGKLKNRLERADLDNFGMDWKNKRPPGSNTKGNKIFSQRLEHVIC